MLTGKGLLRRTLIIISLSLALTSALLLALPTLLKPLLNQWLPQWLGSTEQPAVVHIRELSWRALELDRLQLTLADGTLIQLQELSLSYRLTELVRGHLRDLHIRSVVLNMPAPSAEKVAIAAASSAEQAARSQFNQPVQIPAFSQWLSLPVNDVQVDSFHFQHPAFSAELTAHLTPAQWRINGSSQLDNQPLPWQIEFQLQHSGDWLLLLSEQNTLLMQLYGHVQQDNDVTRIHLDQRADIAALSERLPQLAGLPLPFSQLHIQSELQLPNQGVLPRDAIVGSLIRATTWPQALPGDLHWQSGEWLLTLTKEKADSHWQFRLDGQPQQLQLGASLTGQPLTLRSDQQLSGWCDATLSQCEGSGTITNNLLGAAAQPLAAAIFAPSFHWQQGAAATLRLPSDVSSQAALADVFALPLIQADVRGELLASLSPQGDWQLSSAAGFHSQLILPATGGWTVPPLQLQLLPQLQLHGNLNAVRASERLRMNDLTAELQPLQITNAAGGQHSELKLETGRIRCRPEIFSSGLNSDCQLQLSLAKSGIRGWPLPDVQLSGPFSLNIDDSRQQQRLSARLQLTAAAQQARVRLNLQHDLLSGNGSLQWHLDDLALNWNNMKLGEMTALTRLELLGGTLSGQGWSDWQLTPDGLQITPDLMLRADNISAVYDNSIGLDGWNALTALRRPFNGDYLLDAQFSGNSLNPGIELKDLLARSQTRIPADFSWALIEIQEMHTDILGGRIHTPLIRYDTRKAINAFGIELEHIQLAQLAALEPGADVQANGTLDGVIPIVISPEGVQVPGGNLFARDPGGVIRYHNSTSESLARSDQSVGMAMQLLQNFHYDQLQSGIQYQPDGSLNLGLQFQGNNPDFFGGQKTHLNVNLDYNLLDLLESLRVTQDIISKLEEKYQ